MKQFLLAAGIFLAALGVTNPAAAQKKIQSIESGTCGAGDFVTGYSSTGARQCDTPASGGTPGGSSGDLQTNDGAGGFDAYGGASCTNQFPRSQDASGAWTCATVANADLANSTISGVSLGSTLAALTATDTTLTFSGSYTGATARTVGLNLGNANVWTGTQTFAGVIGTVTTQAGTSYTLDATDCGTVIRFTSGSAVTVTAPNSLVVGCSIAIVQSGTAQVTVMAGASATVVSRLSYTKTAGQYAIIGLTVTTNVGGSAANYILTGDGA